MQVSQSARHHSDYEKVNKPEETVMFCLCKWFLFEFCCLALGIGISVPSKINQ